MEDDQQFCLRWNNHQSTLIQNFDTLLESGTLVDCTLAAEGKYLKAHKVVLSACSPYFEGLLSEHYDKHPVFILKDVKFKELKAMMDYMYRGEVNISQDQLAALLKAAESLQIKGLSESKTGGNHSNSTKTDTRQKTQPPVLSDIPHASSGLTIEKNSKVPRQSIAHVSVADVPEDSASPQLPKGVSSREGSQSPVARKRNKIRRRSVGDDTSMDNHEASNSSDLPQQLGITSLGLTPVDDKLHSDGGDGKSALMTHLTKPADDMHQIPMEKAEPTDNLIEPKSEYLEDPEESVEDLTLDDDMNDLNEMEQDNNRAGPSSHDPSQHPGLAAWHVTGDRSNAGGVVGTVAGAPGANDEVFLAAQEAAQAHRDSQVDSWEHWEVVEDNDPLSANNGRYYCPNCGKDYGYRHNLQRHVLRECGKLPKYQCPYCTSRSKRQDNLYAHIKAVHPGFDVYAIDTGRSWKTLEPVAVSYTSMNERSENRHHCAKCGRSYKRRTHLTRHYNFECGVPRRFRCPYCHQDSKQRSQSSCQPGNLSLSIPKVEKLIIVIGVERVEKVTNDELIFVVIISMSAVCPGGSDVLTAAQTFVNAPASGHTSGSSTNVVHFIALILEQTKLCITRRDRNTIKKNKIKHSR
ncbi:longitudinals lacking protein isoform X2 [Diachasmimorpha longicaudata]|uniref:longitudinals lacking protein isoform X2 n=1 Tax=Diachasmimorpha longicaudata TaxID=58733 RepID=UPI0030B8F260